MTTTETYTVVTAIVCGRHCTIDAEVKITREKLRAWGACYSDERLAELVPAEGATPLQVVDTEHVPATDRLWVLLREEIIPDRELRSLACDWAERACIGAGLTDRRSLEAIAVARRYAGSEVTVEQLATARDTAWVAASEAAWAAAAWAAASEAASEAARAAGAAQLSDVRTVLVRLGRSI